MLYLNPSVRQVLFDCLPSGGGVDRNQTKAKGLPDCKTGSTELPLDQDKVAGPGNPRQPGKDWGEIVDNPVNIRRHLCPDHANVRRRLDNATDSERGTGILLLLRCQAVVEEEDEGWLGEVAGHFLN